MFYKIFHGTNKVAQPLSHFFGVFSDALSNESNLLHGTILGRTLQASTEVPYRLMKSYEKQSYDVTLVKDDMGEMIVEEELVMDRPFCNLLRFHDKMHDGEERPKVLIVAALSGHYATLLRDTIGRFVHHYDVYVTDWKNARDVPVSEGDWGFDEYVTDVIKFQEFLGPDAHMVATCQSTVQCLIATAVMSQQNARYVPRTLTLMAGPIDPRVNGQLLHKLFPKINPEILRFMNVYTVPMVYPGGGRRVYPGMLQLMGFISMNMPTHLKKHMQFVTDIIKGDHEAAERHRAFYDEYFTMLDGTEDFYMETLQRVFYDPEIPQNKCTYLGEPVDFTSIDQRTSLLTIEGGKDEFCPIGQTAAAHDVCPNIPDDQAENFICENVGHYGIFSGGTYRKMIYPKIHDFITQHSASS